MVHGIVETDDKVADDFVIGITSTKMNIEISPADLDRMHEIGEKKSGQNRSRPIIVKLSRHDVSKNIFFNKKTLKGSKFKYNGKLNSLCVTLKLMRKIEVVAW